jgi:effector-binding domain-containing protein
MDRMIGKDFAAGLAKLKTLLESIPDADIAGFTAEEVQLIPAPILLVTETTPIAGIADGYMDGFSKIGKFMAKNKLHQAGAPLGIDGNMSAGNYTFDAGIPVDRGDVASADSVRVSQSYAGKALKTIHVGAYDGLGKTNQKLMAYLTVHGYTPKGAILSSFIDDPGSVPIETLRTEVYAPVE